MNILIISTMTNNFGKKGLYNSQEIGLAHGLAELGNIVHVFKCVKIKEEEEETLAIDDHITITYKFCKCLGSNGFIKLSWLDRYRDVDAVIQFADLQLSVPKIYSWCRKNNIRYIPYVGITFSQSQNKVIKTFIQTLFKRNIRIYRETGCVAKTNDVRNDLIKLGIKQIEVGPVCLDSKQIQIIKTTEREKNVLKEKYGLSSGRVILFIGRFEFDKRPVDMIKLFSQLSDMQSQLLMVGDGVLHKEAEEEVSRLGMEDKVVFLKKIPNKDIWQLYHISDCFINLNTSEIWGMVLLEAMYHKVPVIARNAPGPTAIIGSSDYGFLVDSDSEIIDILNTGDWDWEQIVNNAFERVTTVFNWRNTAKVFIAFCNS